MRSLTRSASVVSLLALSTLTAASAGVSSPRDFLVTITNVSTPAPILDAGVFAVPDGAVDPGPATPGDAYTFVVHATQDHRLSLASMYVQSNDLLVVTPEGGIALHDLNGMPLSGDFSGELSLVDAGTEADQPLGMGLDQAPRQAGPNTGADDPNPTIRAFAAQLSGELSLTITHLGSNAFEVTLANTASAPVGGQPVVISPGAFAVHAPGTNPIYTLGGTDDGSLEPLAEDGDPGALFATLEADQGLATPISPGVGIVHNAALPSFRPGLLSGPGLEALAEDGDPSILASQLPNARRARDFAVFTVPDGGVDAAPAFPGESYTFVVTAREGQRLAFATMLVQSNDYLLATTTGGIDLFPGGIPLNADVSELVTTYDAGTEADAFPGAGPDQAPRQAAPNTGADQHGTLQPVLEGIVSDPTRFITVTVTPL